MRSRRASYDRDAIYSILDSALVCHVGFAIDGQPYVIPTLHVRLADRVYIHGSAASRMLGAAADGTPMAITVTHIDGLVLARSAFHHSVNYRSVVILGAATLVTDPTEKLAVMKGLIDHVAPGRWDHIRHPNEKELAVTSVLSIPIVETSAKIPPTEPANSVSPLKTVERNRKQDEPSVCPGVCSMRIAASSRSIAPALVCSIKPMRRRLGSGSSPEPMLRIWSASCRLSRLPTQSGHANPHPGRYEPENK